MAGLQADELNTEFLRNFLTETLYLVPMDAAAPAPEFAENTAPATAAPVAEAENPIVAPPAAETQIPPPATAPAIPELPKLAATSAFAITGENRKGVVVLVTLADEAFRKLPELEFLQKILRAIGLQQADVAYVNNVSGKVAQLETLQQQLAINYLISFASRLSTSLPHDKFTLYKPVRVGDIPVVFAQALSILEEDASHKKSFWNALQQVFLA